MSTDKTELSHEFLEAVRQSLARYKETVEATDMTPESKRTYLLHSEQFVRWLYGDFEPGVYARARLVRRRR